MTRTHSALLSLLLVSLFYSFAAAGFELKGEISRLQSKFGRSRPYPILIMDKEELQWRFAQADALSEEDEDDVREARRVKIIQAYVKEVIGVELTEIEAMQYDTYATILKDGAFALPLMKSMYPAVYKMCAVMPASPHSNRRLEYDRLLMFKNQDAHQGQHFDDLKTSLSYEVLARFSLYHELAHCLDETFMPKTYEYEDPHSVHLSESFAETVALLMLQEEGYSDIALPRAELRSIYSHRIGMNFAQNPQGGLGNPFYIASGAIYNLADVLLNAPSLNPGDDVYAVARDVVHQFATPSRAFTAITRWLEDAVAAETQYRDWSISAPDLFLESYERLMHYRNTVPLMAQAAFDGTGNTQPVTGVLLPIEKDLCQAFKKKNHIEFEAILHRLTLDLRQEFDTPERQQARQTELQQIYFTMQERCAAH